MKKSTILLAAGFSLAASFAHAEVSKFQGAFAQIGAGYENVSPSHIEDVLTISGGYSSTGASSIDVPIEVSANDESGVMGTIAVGWYQSITDKYLLGLGAEYSPLGISGGSMNVSSDIEIIPGRSYTNEYKYETEDSYSIFLSPAMMIGTDGMLYGKIGYAVADVKAYNSLEYDFEGFSLGLGYKAVINDNWYVFIEANYADFGAESRTEELATQGGPTLSATSKNDISIYNGLLGFGYKF